MHEISRADLSEMDRLLAMSNPPPLHQAEAPAAQPTTHHACTSNVCGSGRRPCPCPQACQLPENSRMAWLFDALERLQPRHFWLGYATFVVAALSGLHLVFVGGR